jgi:hypothetical protein
MSPNSPFQLSRLCKRTGSKQFHDFNKAEYIRPMTKLLDRALRAVRELPAHNAGNIVLSAVWANGV